ncbi:MAG: c-type cytochrome [Gemmataceae bacterium]
MRRTLGWLLVLTLAGCGRLPGKPERPRELKPDEAAARLYATNCSGCHGRDGRLGAAPPLNDARFLALIPDMDLRMIIRAGRPGTPMPGFAKNKGGTLTDEQIELLATQLKKRWGNSRENIDGVPTYLATGKGDAKAGAKVWMAACAGCHGDQGQGATQGAINDPAFLGLITDQAIRRLVITGRPDLGMPGYAGREGRAGDFKPMTEQAVADLVAFVAGWRQSVGGK